MPELKHNLLSVAALTQEGCNVKFSGNQCIINKDEIQWIRGKLKDGLYVLEISPSVNNVSHNRPEYMICLHLLHRCLGHCSFEVVQKPMANACGLKIEKCNTYLDCVVCSQVKSKSDRVTSKPNYCLLT